MIVYCKECICFIFCSTYVKVCWKYWYLPEIDVFLLIEFWFHVQVIEFLPTLIFFVPISVLSISLIMAIRISFIVPIILLLPSSHCLEVSFSIRYFTPLRVWNWFDCLFCHSWLFPPCFVCWWAASLIPRWCVSKLSYRIFSSVRYLNLFSIFSW